MRKASQLSYYPYRHTYGIPEGRKSNLYRSCRAYNIDRESMGSVVDPIFLYENSSGRRGHALRLY